MIDERLGKYEGETLTAGKTITGMIINGLDFSGKPLFFENCPLELLFGEGVKAADFNRFKCKKYQAHYGVNDDYAIVFVSLWDC